MSIYGAYRLLADNAEVITIIVLFLTIPVWRIIATRCRFQLNRRLIISESDFFN